MLVVKHRQKEHNKYVCSDFQIALRFDKADQTKTDKQKRVQNAGKTLSKLPYFCNHISLDLMKSDSEKNLSMALIAFRGAEDYCVA